MYPVTSALLLLLAASALPTTRATRNITGSSFPFIVAADGAAPSSFVVRGAGFGTAADQPSDLVCRAKFGDFVPGINITQSRGPAKVLNDTAILCTGMGGVAPGGAAGIAVESASHSDPAKHVWWSSGVAAAQYATFVEVTPDRRPYLSNETSTASLLVAVDTAAIAAYPPTANAVNVTLCATLEQPSPTSMLLNPSLVGLQLLPCVDLALADLASRGGNGVLADSGAGFKNGAVFAVPFSKEALAKLQLQASTGLAAVVRVTARIGASFQLVPKERRFAVAPVAALAPGQSYTAVDHRRRMISLNGEPWLGVGFYYSGWPARGTTTIDDAVLEVGKNDMREFVRQGLTQIMPYGFISICQNDPQLANLKKMVSWLDGDAEMRGQLKFDMPLVAETEAAIRSEPGTANYTKAWAAIEAKVAAVKHSKSLLAYYICDDCNNPTFPPAKMAAVYQRIKQLDPHHITVGAPWATPWALFAFGESAGYLSLDYAQVENYIPEPGLHSGDPRIRAGQLFEPIANSPPTYILQGFDGDGKTPARPWPPVLESTLSWLGAIQFGAPNVVNFVWEPAPLNHSARGLNGQGHLAAQAEYGRIAKKLLPALLPDVTDTVAGRELPVAVTTSSKCALQLPATSGKKPYDFGTQPSVVAGGFRQAWEAGFCAFVVVANLCNAPGSYTIKIDLAGGGDAALSQLLSACGKTCTVAQHEFTSAYNVTAVPAVGEPGVFTVTDMLGGYDASILRIGCDGWSEGQTA